MMASTRAPSSEDKACAAKFKDQGNKLFGEKHYESAIEQYSRAIDTDPTNPVYFSNRALAYLRTECYLFALSDADKAIKLDSKFAKAYFRRAAANICMLKFKEAYADLTTLLGLQPGDSVAKKKHEECGKIIRRQMFEKAISGATPAPKTFEEMINDLSSLTVEENYDGARIPEAGITPEFVVELMECCKKQCKIHKKLAYTILAEARAIFEKYDSLVHIDVPQDGRLIVCGDTHGQFFDLCNIFAINGNPSTKNAYLFNGDFVDRGSFSVEVILVLLAWKVAIPVAMHLTRGNHETVSMNQVYGFEGEVTAKLPGGHSFNVFTEVFNALPLVIIIGKKIMVVHGGLPSTEGVKLDEIRKINRFSQPPDAGIMSDLLWSDPQEALGFGPSKRCIGSQFGPDVTERFLANNGLDTLIRSHEAKEKGYDVAHNGKCITIFSAPNYCDAAGNLGAYIIVTPDLKMDFRTFTAVPHPNVPAMFYSSGGMNM